MRCAELKASCRPSCRSTGLRISAVGNDVAVREGGAQWQADIRPAGDGLRGRAGRGSVAFLSARRAGAGAGRRRRSADDAAFSRGEALESSDRARRRSGLPARARRSIPITPTPTSTSARCCARRGAATEAVALYDEALAAQARRSRCCTSIARSRSRTPAGRRRRCAATNARLQLAPDLADAHYNAARLHEQLGDAKRGAPLQRLPAARAPPLRWPGGSASRWS